MAFSVLILSSLNYMSDCIVSLSLSLSLSLSHSHSLSFFINIYIVLQWFRQHNEKTNPVRCTHVVNTMSYLNHFGLTSSRCWETVWVCCIPLARGGIWCSPVQFYNRHTNSSEALCSGLAKCCASVCVHSSTNLLMAFWPLHKCLDGLYF